MTVLLSIPAFTSQTESVEKTSMIGKPAEKPKPAIVKFSFFKNIFNSLIIYKILRGFKKNFDYFRGTGVSLLLFIYAITFALSLSFFKPIKPILVPFMYFIGL